MLFIYLKSENIYSKAFVKAKARKKRAEFCLPIVIVSERGNRTEINFIAFAKNLNFNAEILLNEIKFKDKVCGNCLLNGKLFAVDRHSTEINMKLLIFSTTLENSHGQLAFWCKTVHKWNPIIRVPIEVQKCASSGICNEILKDLLE